MADLSCIHMLAGDSWYMGAFKYLHWYDLLFNFFIGLVYSDALRGIYILAWSSTDREWKRIHKVSESSGGCLGRLYRDLRLMRT